MGNRERILWADDMIFLHEGALFEFVEEDGHEIVGKAKSVEEVDQLLDEGINPTVAIVDANMPSKGDGEKAAAIIRERSPETKIVSFSSQRQTWGDENWTKDMGLNQILEGIKKL
ncbi:hypothetical protein A2630_01345 [Candidatus Woesebacteria bacterium RIFCSPHIGHO2_01_FULL_44_10]|uniref:Response regulatory domain-containing protein n=1 Tax=Candidatus Woesebacteria bacterium RIFCSPLOWO2_01_FULL_44_14 TaxID=1802525 RepID=A0A1F8C1I0_9BACT|nr:MAG: hypothetical protein A2630_01345 [Candidatus Woesebacteria bacterium RIFCSPHIGHO2_01_FULL_44_10]OGM55686.1 MAG: hypothetical protein A3F62_02585 [Candidatus Woesebacteria bacterium RIFCSPHIGHO2_12_FULL_44_11]OGM70112.1 MAG: hypothetical protein A2975_03485 [Candidatus Woesebacteria bacterium RIFCSPLOWO2_01_FULL_44_14]